MAVEGVPKLFVGQVPKTMLEEDLRPMFIPFGTVVDVHVIRDHNSKNHKGCAFVTFSTKEETEACIYGLHNKITLPGMQCAMQVKYAGENPRSVVGVLPGGGGGNTPGAAGTTHKLFVGMVPKNYTEEDLRPIFMPFGEIKDMNVLRGNDGLSRGCAFILFKEVPSAVQAITTLNGKIKLEGAPSNLVVQFASSSDKNRGANLANQSVVSTPSQLQFMLQQPQTFLDPYAALGPSALSYPPYMLQPQPGVGAPPPYGYPQQAQGLQAGALGSNKEGPPGSNLFIYHLPKDYNDASLLAMFSQFGTVLSCKIITDKDTGESKGFGFVSYESPDGAQLAIANTNGMNLPGGKRLKVEVKAPRSAGGRPY